MSTTITKPMAHNAPAGAPANGARIDARTWIAVLAGMLGAFMAVLDIQITNSSLRDILGTLSATLEEGSWISTAYLCAEIVVIPMIPCCSNCAPACRSRRRSTCARPRRARP